MALPLLTLKDAACSVAGARLFSSLDVEVARGERVCLVGRNGSGKSTLMQALAGDITLDGGTRFVQPRTLVSRLSQHSALPARGRMLDTVIDDLPTPMRDEQARIRALHYLEALELPPEGRLEGLSGGQRRRLSLAQVLTAAPEILLLDEPTNHLDLPAITWLEQQLRAFKGAIVAVSHDRRFLATISNRTWWLERGRLFVNNAGYEHFESWRDALLEAEEHELSRLDKHLAAEEHWLRRGVTARRKRNQGRLRKLQDLRSRRAAYLKSSGTARLKLETESGGGTCVIEALGITKSHGGERIVDRFSTRILSSDRIGVIGRNGAGKTTLLKLLTGALAPDEGEVRLGTGLSLARFDQDRSLLDAASTPWRTLCPDGGDQVMVHGRSRHVVGYLRDFLFREEQVLQPIAALSGGERSRLVMAHILARPSNLLVLDEPTNDLDIETLDLLEEVLGDYRGTLLVVSHDRAFLDFIVTSTIVCAGDGRIEEHAGGYSDWLAQASEEKHVATDRPSRDSTLKKGGAIRAARKEQERLLRELERLPGEIERQTDEIASIEREMAAIARDPQRLTELQAGDEERLEAQERLARLEERWLELEMWREAALSGA